MSEVKSVWCHEVSNIRYVLESDYSAALSREAALVLPENADFEEWVSGRQVCKKYGAKLTRRPDGSYSDFRINDQYLAWNACLDEVTRLNPKVSN